MECETEKVVRNKADLLSGLVFLGFGLVVLYLSWTMPRLEARNIHPLTIPGLVPMGLGASLAVLGFLLAFKSRHAARGSWSRFFGVFATMEALRALSALGLIVVFALVLVGRMPFWAASMIFLFTFIILMEAVLLRRPQSKPCVWRNAVIWAATTALLAGSGIYYLFAELLLVRLP